MYFSGSSFFSTFWWDEQSFKIQRDENQLQVQKTTQTVLMAKQMCLVSLDTACFLVPGSTPPSRGSFINTPLTPPPLKLIQCPQNVNKNLVSTGVKCPVYFSLRKSVLALMLFLRNRKAKTLKTDKYITSVFFIF